MNLYRLDCEKKIHFIQRKKSILLEEKNLCYITFSAREVGISG